MLEDFIVRRRNELLSEITRRLVEKEPRLDPARAFRRLALPHADRGGAIAIDRGVLRCGRELRLDAIESAVRTTTSPPKGTRGDKWLATAIIPSRTAPARR